jgi:hypothetical protein
MISTATTLVAGALLGPLLSALPQSVIGEARISSRFGGLPTALADNDQLGRSVAVLGDLDGDGVVDLATAGHADGTGGEARGSVHILFLDSNGAVKAGHKITSVSGDILGPVDDGDQIARALAAPGDLDLDGIPDLIVSANMDDDGGPDRGAFYVLYLRRDGTVRSEAKVSSTSGGLAGLGNRDQFGRSLAPLGDLDGDGIIDLAVGAPYDDGGGSNVGAVHVLFMNGDGTVKGQSKIGPAQGGFGGLLAPGDMFGFSLAALGDVDGDGVPDLAAGAVLDDDGGFNCGAVWILLMQTDGTVHGWRKITAAQGGFTDPLGSSVQFGFSVACIGDVDADGRPELVVGTPRDDDGGRARGALWMLSLHTDGSVLAQHKISQLSGGFGGRIGDWDAFGASVAALGDFNADGVPDLVAGARFADDGGLNRGALHLLFLKDDGALPPDPPTPDPNLVDLALLFGRPGPGRYLTFSCGFPEGSLPAVAFAPPGGAEILRLTGTIVRDGRFVVRMPASFTPPPELEAQGVLEDPLGGPPLLSVTILLP